MKEGEAGVIDMATPGLSEGARLQRVRWRRPLTWVVRKSSRAQALKGSLSFRQLPSDCLDSAVINRRSQCCDVTNLK
jgi:hypothetical protein